MTSATFKLSIERSKRFLMLYKILNNDRKRDVRADWSSRFKEFMRWPANEEIIRIDGHNRNSMLILRARLGISSSEFEHEILSELLRASVVTAVSALDRYMHDLVMKNIWSLLDKGEDSLGGELKKL
jgi:hypothetical protein